MITVNIEATEQGLEAVRIRHDGGRAATLDVLEQLMPHIRAMSTTVGRVARGEPERPQAA
jgi:hypothetical protein